MVYSELNYICRASDAGDRTGETTAGRVIEVMIKNRKTKNRQADETYDQEKRSKVS